MRSQACSPCRRGLSLNALTTSIPVLLILMASIAGSGRQQEKVQRSELGLEISLPDSRRPRLRLVGPRGGGGMTLILRESLKINDPRAAGDFTALDVRSAVEGEAMRVNLYVIYNDVSMQEWWKDKKEKAAGSYLIREGEPVWPTELAQFGIEPFEMKLISAGPIVFKPGEGPRIINNTTALEVARLEKHLDSYLIALKNISSKNVVAYTILTGSSGVSSSNGGRGNPVIAAGAITRETHLYAPNVELDGITISNVIFDDGSFEGDAKIATQFLAASEGVNIQSPSVLRMIEQTLKVDDSDLRAAFIKLEAELWVIPEAMYKPAALQFLKTKFPAQDENNLSTLYEDFKGGLYDARNIALSALGDTVRSVKSLEERGDFASAVESIRRTLERLRETFGKIVAAQR